MHSSRPAVFLALTSVVLSTGVASAVTKKPVPKPVCNLVVDPAGDAGVITAQDGLDIRSADIASDAKNVTAVIRLKSAPKAANPEAPGGSYFYFLFRAPGSGNPQFLSAAVPFSGAPEFGTGQVTTTGGQSITEDDPAGAAVGSIRGNVITVSARRGAFSRVNMRPGVRLTQLTVEARVLIGALGSGSLILADEAVSKKTYIAGTPSCVKPGR